VITLELLSRLLAIAVELGELHFPPEISAKICDRLLELVFTVDHQELCALSNELQKILADEGAAQERRVRGALH
jgi:hypothetical protein